MNIWKFKKFGKKLTPIRNEPNVYCSLAVFQERLKNNRERTIVDLCKFITGKRKRAAVTGLESLPNEEITRKALALGFVTL